MDCLDVAFRDAHIANMPESIPEADFNHCRAVISEDAPLFVSVTFNFIASLKLVANAFHVHLPLVK